MATPPTARADYQPRYRRFLAALGVSVLPTVDADPSTSPTVISGAGVPSMTAPQGTLYLRSDGGSDTTLYANVDGGTTWVAAESSAGELIFAAATELTIAAGAIAATQVAHTVDTEADAASDALTTITGGSAEELLLLRANNAARTVVVTHGIGANQIACPGGRNISLAEATDFIALYNNGTQWVVVGYSTLALGGGGLGLALASTANGDGAALVSIEDAAAIITATTVEGALAENRAALDLNTTHRSSDGSDHAFLDQAVTIAGTPTFATVSTTAGGGTFLDHVMAAATELTIAAGVVAATQGYHRIDTEADAASDNLTSITGGTDGERLLIRLENAARTVQIDHGIGADLISTPLTKSIFLNGATDWALLVHDGTQWTVVAFKVATAGAGGLGAALSSTGAGEGASLVGIQDALGQYTAANLEAYITEAALERQRHSIADPGNAGAIVVTRSGVCAMTSAGAGETRTMAAPTFLGQRVSLIHDVDGGDIAVTVAQDVNQANNTILTFAEVEDACELVAMQIAGALHWRITYNDGVALS